MTELKKTQIIWLDELSSKEAAQAAKSGTVIIFPLGSVEEHGDHLPLGTDSFQPEHIAVEVAKKTGCLVAPPFRYGICNATRNFPGTLTLQFDTLYKVTHDILSELIRNGFSRIIVLSGHAGNSHMVALRLAAQDIITKKEDLTYSVRIMVLSDYDFVEDLAEELKLSNDGHAGTIETSRLIAIKPELVKEKGKAEKWAMPRFEVVAHPENYFPGGVNGDPTLASKEKGNRINSYIVDQVEKLVKQLKAR